MDIDEKAIKTLQTMEAYGKRLKYNTILNIFVNGLAIFIVLKFSTKAMQWYKYFILTTIISAFFMDFHSSFIYGIFIIFPTTISCPTGLAKWMGWFWGNFVQYTILHLNMGFCGLSIFYSFLYQYISLTNNPEILHKTKAIAAMFISMLLYPIPSIILFSINVDYEGGKAFTAENYPYISEIYVIANCNMFLINSKLYAYLIVSIIEVVAVYFGAIILSLKIHFKLKEFKNSMSASTMKARKQFLTALIFQSTVPLIFIVIPVTSIIIIVGFRKGSLEDISQYMFQFFCIHSCGNALAVLFIIKPYREALFQWIQPIKSIFCKKHLIEPSTFFVSVNSSHFTKDKR